MNSFVCEAESYLCRMAVLVALCAALTGCRNNPYLDSHIEILNAEKRALEDQVYAMERDYERKAAELEDAKEEIERLRGGGSGRRDQAPRERNAEAREETEEPLDLRPPTTTPGEPVEPEVEWPEKENLPSPNDGSQRFRDGLTEPVSAPPQIQPGDPRITHIHIDPLRTGGTDFDQEPGDDGITLVVEPRNADNEFVPLAGPLSVVVLDYNRRADGDAARLGRWELDAQQVERSMTNSDLERGVHLRLAWSDDKPTDSKLLVAVRYTTADGRQLEARRDIFITLPGQFSQRWTPRSSTRTADQRNESLNEEQRPSETDGVSSDRRLDGRAAYQAEVAPARFTAAQQRRDVPKRPTWRPYR